MSQTTIRRPRTAGSTRRVLLTLAGIVAAVALLAGGVFAVALATRTTTTETRTVSPDGIDVLELTGGAGGVVITAEDRTDVAVTRRRTSNLLSEAVSELAVRGDTLAVDARCGSSLFDALCSVERTIAVPRDALDRVDVRHEPGADRHVSVRAGAGEITIRRR